MLEVLILAVLSVWLIAAIRNVVRSKKMGKCTGCCNNCSMCMSDCNKVQKI